MTQRYHAEFYGRTRGAIGVFYKLQAFADGIDTEAAKLALYDDYEHLSGVRLTPLVLRYVATYKPASGPRTLARAAQGRCTHDTEADAQAWIAAVLAPGTNNPNTLIDVFGPDPRFEARPVWCWPGHFDPTTVYFDEKENTL